MIIGFTGTRDGMTYQQKKRLAEILDVLGCCVFHHGDCIGADREAAELAFHAGHQIVGHPPDKDGLRAFFKNDVTLPAAPYLMRNRDIVDASDLMIATPKEKEEQPRGGTWSTIRYAIKQQKNLAIIYPDGTLWENFDDKRATVELDQGRLHS